MPLSGEQREALEQLWAVTASESDASRERDERLLRENGFDVQRTVEQIFSMGSEDPAPPAGPSRQSSLRSYDQFEEESPMLPRTPVGGRRLSGTGTGMGGRRIPGGTGLGLWGAITLPVRLVMGILSGTWYFLISTFMPLSFLPYMPRLLLPPTSAPTPRLPRDPTTTSLSWVRDLEQYTGSSAASGTMPDFWVGPYREFLSDVRKQGRIGLVVFVCDEHEDDEEFKRDVLCDPELVRFIKEKDIMVWGADIRSREGYQASQTLLTTTYPALTFLSLLPTPSSSSPKLTVLTTVAGPPSTTTSTSSLIQLITTSILPRTSAFLARLKRERLTLEESRHLRAEQDRAFREAEARDREKMQRAKDQERQERLEREAVEQARRAKEDEVENRRVWRRYARKHLLPPAAPAGTAPGSSVRVAMRIPSSSERNVRNFLPGPSTAPLFIYAETLLIPADQTPETDPDHPPAGYTPPDDFRIVTNYPRLEIARVEQGGEAVWEQVKKAGGALFAEKKEDGTWGDAESAASDDEDSDEEKA